jgi:hypothetical protein
MHFLFHIAVENPGKEEYENAEKRDLAWWLSEVCVKSMLQDVILLKSYMSH